MYSKHVYYLATQGASSDYCTHPADRLKADLATFEPQGCYLKVRPVFERANALFIHALAKQLVIPLAINWRQRTTEALQVGAIWSLRLTTDRTSEMYVATPATYIIVQEDEHEVAMRRYSRRLHGLVPGEQALWVRKAQLLQLFDLNPRRDYRLEDAERTWFGTGHPLCPDLALANPDQPTPFMGLYAGHLPEPFNTTVLQGGELTMETPTAFETDVIRGPRVSVTVHTLDMTTLPPPPDSSVEALKSLKLEHYPWVTSTFGINLAALEPGNVVHERCAKVVTALLTEGYLDQTRIERLNGTKTYQPFFHGLEEGDPRPLLLHPNADDPRLISYYMGWDHLIRGRKSVAKPGKLIRQLYPDRSDELVKKMTSDVQMEVLPDEFVILDDPAEITAAYMAGPSSCATYTIPSTTSKRYTKVPQDQGYRAHPTRVYGGESDIKLAVLRKGDAVIARCLINPHRMQAVRLYGREGTDGKTRLRNWLGEQGYEMDGTALIGATLRRVEVTTDDVPHVLLPYIDCGGLSVVDTGTALVVTGNSWLSHLTPRAGDVLANAPLENGHLRTYSAAHTEGAFCAGRNGTLLRVTRCDCGGITDKTPVSLLTAAGTMRKVCSHCISRDDATLDLNRLSREHTATTLAYRLADGSLRVSPVWVPDSLRLPQASLYLLRKLHPLVFADINADHIAITPQVVEALEVLGLPLDTIDGITVHAAEIVTTVVGERAWALQCKTFWHNNQFHFINYSLARATPGVIDEIIESARTEQEHAA